MRYCRSEASRNAVCQLPMQRAPRTVVDAFPFFFFFSISCDSPQPRVRCEWSSVICVRCACAWRCAVQAGPYACMALAWCVTPGAKVFLQSDVTRSEAVLFAETLSSFEPFLLAPKFLLVVVLLFFDTALSLLLRFYSNFLSLFLGKFCVFFFPHESLVWRLLWMSFTKCLLPWLL